MRDIYDREPYTDSNAIRETVKDLEDAVLVVDEARAAVESAQEAVDDAQEALNELVEEVHRRCAETDDYGGEWDSGICPDLSDILPDFDAATLIDNLPEIADAFDEACRKAEEAHHAEQEWYYANQPKDCTPDVGRFPLPDGYTSWASVPMDKLPADNHYRRLPEPDKFAARVSKDPRTREVCGSCGQHYRARNWVGPCTDCYHGGA